MLGCHVSRKSQVLPNTGVAQSMSAAIRRDCDSHGLNYAQIFTHGPSSWTANNLDKQQITNIDGIGFVVHSAYPTTAVWKITEQTLHTQASRTALGFLKSQLQAARDIDAIGVVLHIGRVPAQQAAYVMRVIRPIAIECRQQVILEMTASKADANTYDTPAKINHLTALIGAADNWWGWCVDTAHIWAAGQDIRTKAGMAAWFDSIEHWSRIKLFHLNGSSKARFSGKDVHEVVFCAEDKIWHNVRPQDSGVAALVECAIEHQIPIILEINRGSEAAIEQGIEQVKQLMEQTDAGH